MPLIPYPLGHTLQANKADNLVPRHSRLHSLAPGMASDPAELSGPCGLDADKLKHMNYARHSPLSSRCHPTRTSTFSLPYSATIKVASQMLYSIFKLRLEHKTSYNLVS